MATEVTGWGLRSLGMTRKYLGPIEAAIATFVLRQPDIYGGVDPSLMYAVNSGGVDIAHAGMEAHVSQLVWYRRLFLRFSQVIYINVFERV